MWRCMMLWLMVLLLWSMRIVFYGTSAASPAARVFYYLLALLGILQVAVTAIDMLEFIMAIIYA